jgi:hypothetical protein
MECFLVKNKKNNKITDIIFADHITNIEIQKDNISIWLNTGKRIMYFRSEMVVDFIADFETNEIKDFLNYINEVNIE